MKNIRTIDCIIIFLIVCFQLSTGFRRDKFEYELNERIDKLEAKLDSIQYNDTIYIDVDDMSQADWRSYTPGYLTEK